MPGLTLPAAMRLAPPLDPRAPAPPPTPRHALLLNPFYSKDPHGSFGKHVLAPALALTGLAAATSPDWTVALWDENLLQGPPPLDPFPALVGITVHLTFARRAYELARWYRARGALVVLGGPHVQSCPSEAREHADALVFSGGVRAWPRVLADAERGALSAEYRGSYRGPFDGEPVPRRELLPRGSFLTTASLVATRGCSNRCRFCHLATEGLDLPFQARDPARVAAEWEATGEPYAVFLDNNLGARPEVLRALCRALAPLQRIWSAAVTLDVTDDPSLVREMALAGCTGVFVGLETLEAENLRAAGKRSPPPSDYARRVRILHDAGIQVNGSFVLGFDADGPEVFERTADWIERQRLECATFHILTPYPGTPLFRRLEQEGRLLHRDWELYDTAHVVFRPARMTETQLAEGYAWLYRRLFSPASIWARRPEDAGAVLPYLAMSVLYKKTNRLWPFLIRHRLVGPFWRPLIALSRRRHLAFRRRLALAGTMARPSREIAPCRAPASPPLS
jgi:radical SAM superfamily enzyme YgiQ (UPF0313 family)